MTTSELKKLPGLRESQLLDLGKCAVCGKPLPHDMLFYHVTVSRYGFEADAVKRRVGMGQAFGDVVASLLGPDEVLARQVAPPVTRGVHEHCAGNINHLLELMEEK